MYVESLQQEGSISQQACSQKAYCSQEMELPFQRTSALVRQAYTRAVVFNLDRASQSPAEFKAQIPGPHPRITDSVGLGQGAGGGGQRICISNKFPDNADVANPEIPL